MGFVRRLAQPPLIPIDREDTAATEVPRHDTRDSPRRTPPGTLRLLRRFDSLNYHLSTNNCGNAGGTCPAVARRAKEDQRRAANVASRWVAFGRGGFGIRRFMKCPTIFTTLPYSLSNLPKSLKSTSTMNIEGPKGETDFTISSLVICSLTICWKLSRVQQEGLPGN